MKAADLLVVGSFLLTLLLKFDDLRGGLITGSGEIFQGNLVSLGINSHLGLQQQQLLFHLILFRGYNIFLQEESGELGTSFCQPRSFGSSPLLAYE